ncbi:hypothetical protein QVD17_35481 [Tagetes erecta]|uniref:Uncharacterized protein n=1 Tax=Tagetes erecta TaxID=13708 RepID=A0AAD8NL96_TARER|nr:hypothetical protein QVD17_35481 [Tagetes erecta]
MTTLQLQLRGIFFSDSPETQTNLVGAIFCTVVSAGDLDVAFGIMNCYDEPKLIELLLKRNQSGETPLYVAAEYGCVDLVKEMIKSR